MALTVSLPDGSARELPDGANAADLAAAIGPRLAADAVIAVVDGEERDLDRRRRQIHDRALSATCWLTPDNQPSSPDPPAAARH